MKKGECIGLLGGLGVAASIFYYKGLAKAHDERGVTLDLVMTHAEVPRVFEYVQAEDRAGLAEYLLGFVNRLAAAGSTCAVLPAVTPHYAIRELQERSPISVFNLFDPLRDEVRRRQLRRVAVFGTKFVMQSKLYGMLPEVEIVPWQTEQEAAIDETYTALALRGSATEDESRRLTELGEELCQREAVDAILLAGTDLVSVFHDEKASFPVVDCAAVHLRGVANAVLGPE